MKRNFVKITMCAFLAMSVVTCVRNEDNSKGFEVVADSVDKDQVLSVYENREMTSEEMISIKMKMDSLIKAPGRAQLSESSAKLFLIPDSILKDEAIMTDSNFEIQKYWTPEQREKDRILAQIQIENVKLIGGKLKVDISKDEFVKKGLPADYYDFLVQSYNDINFYNELYKNSPEKVEHGWKIMQASHKERMDQDCR